MNQLGEMGSRERETTSGGTKAQQSKRQKDQKTGAAGSLTLAFRLGAVSGCKCGAYDWRGTRRDCLCRQLNVVGDADGWFWTFCGPEIVDGSHCIAESDGEYASSFEAVKGFYDWLRQSPESEVQSPGICNGGAAETATTSGGAER